MSAPFSDVNPQLLLLGGFEVRWQGIALDSLSYIKMRALLAYLAMEPREHSREALAGLLWPGNDLSTARGNLRRTLADLRRVLPKQSGEWFAVTKNSIRFISTASVDARIFLEFCRKKSSKETKHVINADQCIDLYKGELLQGLSLPECIEFEEWLLIQRETMHRCVLALLEQECSRCEHAGKSADALRLCERITSLEPWNESGYYRAMQLHAVNKQYSAALAIYECCCQVLRKELGVLPSDATRTLAETIRANLHSHRLDVRAAHLLTESNQKIIHRIPLTVEQRQVTVLYCELSSQVADCDDPNDLMKLLAPLQTACIDTVIRYGGHVMQSHGGGFLAYFGYPQAHEHAARYAVQAALKLPSSNQVNIHASVHTGLILVDENSLTPDTLGRTSKIAIQLRHFAIGRDVVISEATHKLTHGYFTFASAGIKEMSGFYPTLKIPIFYVTAESGVRTRFDTAASLTPLVGRRSEIEYFIHLWNNTNIGHGASHLIQAEAGLGKSRLLYTLKNQLTGSACGIYELRCFPEFSQSPFHPFIAMFETLLGIEQHQTSEKRFELLDLYLKQPANTLSSDALLLLSYLLSLPEGITWAEGLSPQKLKEKTTAVLLEFLQSLSLRQRVLLIIEDLHWIDPSSLELLHTFLIQQQASNIRTTLVVLTARPEFVAPWSNVICTPFMLSPLSSDDVKAMVTSLFLDIPTGIINRITERADGVPLFVEELVKVAMSDQFASVPNSLQDLLMERIDRLGEARYLIQIASCLGREFTVDMLKRIFPGDRHELQRNLDELSKAGLIHTQDIETWQFKHALVQDAAYALQTKSSRQQTHRFVAQAIQNSFVELAEAQPELLAQHWSAAGEPLAAIPLWIKSGQRAMRSSAIVEATEHFKNALQLLKIIPDEVERNCNEFAILTNYAPVLYAMHGYGSEEAQQANNRISELIMQVGDSPDLFWGKWSFVMNTIASGSAPNGGALSAAQQLLALPNSNPIHVQAAHHAVANAAFWCGQFDISYKHAEVAIDLFEPAHRPRLLQQCGTDLSIFSRSYLACSLFFLGNIERAEALCEEKLVLARATNHPHTLAQALSFAATLYRWIGKPNRVLELSVETIELSRAQDFSLWLACGEMTHGWSLVRLAQPELGFAKLHASVQGMRSSLCGIPTVFISALAEAHMYAHQYQEALALFDEALVNLTTAGDGGLYQAEIYRLRGECLLALSGPSEDVHFCFDQALAISRQQNARTLYSRAQMSKKQL